jgi:hypothetical protein
LILAYAPTWACDTSIVYEDIYPAFLIDNMFDNLGNALVTIHIERELMDDATREIRDFFNLARGGVHDTVLAREFLAAISGLGQMLFVRARREQIPTVSSQCPQ